jgi:CxxC motif-containing protein (DUF1111 family)
MRLGLAFAFGLTAASIVTVQSGATPASLREMLLSLPVTDRLGGDTTRPVAAQNAFSFQAANAPREHQRVFSFGNRLFNTNWVEAPASVKTFDGLGPLFNRVSCAACHTKDGRGTPPPDGQGPMDSLLLRVSVPGFGPHGGPKPVPGYGEQLSERGITGVPAEGRLVIEYEELPGSYGDGAAFTLRKPTYRVDNLAYGSLPDNILLSPRIAPQVIGLGLLEAVPPSTLETLADPDDANGDGISGRTNLVWDAKTQTKAIGKFGWKAGQPDLLNQNVAAALGDIGLTSAFASAENCDPIQASCSNATTGGTPEISTEFIEKLTLYTATLAVPAQRKPDDAGVVAGAAVFRDMQCSSCHMPTLKSGPHILPEVANQTFHPYTDMLLHDLGEGLADNRPEFDATGREWRTPPLWGLGLVQTVNGHLNLLHDGRARGFEEAILWHGGEAEAAREAFRLAPKSSRDALIAFLSSL